MIIIPVSSVKGREAVMSVSSTVDDSEIRYMHISYIKGNLQSLISFTAYLNVLPNLNESQYLVQGQFLMLDIMKQKSTKKQSHKSRVNIAIEQDSSTNFLNSRSAIQSERSVATLLGFQSWFLQNISCYAKFPPYHCELLNIY